MKDQYIGMNMKQEKRIKIRQMNTDIFSDQILLELIDYCINYFNRNNDIKRFNAQKHYLPKGIIDTYNVNNNGKNFYDQPIDFDIKRYKEIRKLTRVKIILKDVY